MEISLPGILVNVLILVAGYGFGGQLGIGVAAIICLLLQFIGSM